MACAQSTPHATVVCGQPSLEDAAVYVAKLPRLHADPFDRLLVAQAVVNGMTILTPDAEIEQYAVRTLW